MDLLLLQLAIFGSFTGLGTTSGAKLAELLLGKPKKRVAKP